MKKIEKIENLASEHNENPSPLVLAQKINELIDAINEMRSSEDKECEKDKNFFSVSQIEREYFPNKSEKHIDVNPEMLKELNLKIEIPECACGSCAEGKQEDEEEVTVSVTDRYHHTVTRKVMSKSEARRLGLL